MLEQEDPEVPSSHRHTKTTIKCRTTISKNDLKNSKTDFLQIRIQRKGHIKIGRRGRDVFQSEPTLPIMPVVSQPMKGGISQLQGYPLRSKGSKPHIQVPSPGDLHQGDEPPCLSLKNSRAYIHIQESQRVVGNREFVHEGLAHKLTHSAQMQRHLLEKCLNHRRRRFID